EAVFERELDGVLEADLQLAVVNELINTRRVGEHGSIDVLCLVRLKNVWESFCAVGVVVARDSQRRDGCDAGTIGGRRRRVGRRVLAGALSKSGRKRPGNQ